MGAGAWARHDAVYPWQVEHHLAEHAGRRFTSAANYIYGVAKPDVPTVNEILDKRKAPEVTWRLAMVLMAPDAIGRPLIAPPGMPADRLAMLREALIKALADPEFKAEAQKRNWEIEPVTGQELEAIAKKVVVQPPDVIERMKKVLAN